MKNDESKCTNGNKRNSLSTKDNIITKVNVDSGNRKDQRKALSKTHIPGRRFKQSESQKPSGQVRAKRPERRKFGWPNAREPKQNSR